MRTGIPALLILAATLSHSLPVMAKEPYAQGALLTVITSMPEGSWAKVNANLFSDVWTPADQRPLNGAGNPTPDRLIRAWSGYAWDSNRGDLILYGGGHANYSGNDVYRWRARSLLWERASLPSEIYRWNSTVYYWPVDGTDAAPSSAHTYDNGVFLPHFDRYLNFGGAIYNSGGAYVREDELDPTRVRTTGPYFFDPAKANPNQVGGTTGSHVKRVAPFADVTGGNMWQNRDFTKNQAGKTIPARHVGGCTAYGEENGRDVVYVGAGASPNATSPSLYRYGPGDVLDPASDDITRVGIYWTGTSGQTTCAVDLVRNVFVRTGNSTNKPFIFWNLATLGPTNKDQTVSVTGPIADFTNWLAATGKQQSMCAIDHDPVRQRFVLWCGDGALWSLVPPTPLAASGWTMAPIESTGTVLPPGRVDTGVLGKWKYIPGFDVFLGLQHEIEGQIWIYKPVGWQAPNTSNIPPTITIQAPISGSEVIKGEPFSLLADALDSDGTIGRVDFKVNGAYLGSVTTFPYTLDWTPTALGTASITAIATDNSGAETESAAVAVLVKSAPGSSEPVTKVLQRGLGGYAKSSDVYLNKFSPGINTGSAATLLVYGVSYTPLVRFAIFEREGGPVPDNATINSARLSIYKSNYDFVYRLHPMLREWAELEANWNGPRAGEIWAVAGAGGVDSDYAGAFDAQVSTLFAPGWMNFDVTDRLAIWQGGQPNFGWRIVGVSGNGNLKQLYSSEYAIDASLRPKLEITYTAP